MIKNAHVHRHTHTHTYLNSLSHCFAPFCCVIYEQYDVQMLMSIVARIFFNKSRIEFLRRKIIKKKHFVA